MEAYDLLFVTIAVLALLFCVVIYAVWLKFQLWMQTRSLDQLALVHTHRTPRDMGTGSGCLLVLLFLITVSIAVALVLLGG